MYNIRLNKLINFIIIKKNFVSNRYLLRYSIIIVTLLAKKKYIYIHKHK